METTGVFADTMRLWIGWAAFGIELLAVGAIIIAVLIMTARGHFIRHLFKRPDESGYERYKHHLGKALLLGLELLVAADVVRTVTLAPTMENVLMLGILVIVRTILSWSLIVEMEGRWPWQAAAAEERAAGVPPASTPTGGRS